MFVALDAAVRAHGLTSRARVAAMTAAGVTPCTMGVGPIKAAQRLFAQTGLSMIAMDVI